MSAGNRKTYITLQQIATWITNDFGEPVSTWADVVNLWADEQDLNMRESFYAGQIRPDITKIWNIRYTTYIDRKMRIKQNSTEYYEIVSIKDIKGNKRELQILGAKLTT